MGAPATCQKKKCGDVNLDWPWIGRTDWMHWLAGKTVQKSGAPSDRKHRHVWRFECLETKNGRSKLQSISHHSIQTLKILLRLHTCAFASFVTQVATLLSAPARACRGAKNGIFF